MTCPRPLCGRPGRICWQPLFLGLLSLCSVFLAHPSAAETFPVPATLRANVDFWRDIYVRYSENEIVFHDREDLSLVYRVISVPPRGERRQGRTRREHVQQGEKELIEALSYLSKRRPTGPEGLPQVAREVFERLRSVRRADKYERVEFLRAQNGLREGARAGWARFGRYEPQVREALWRAKLPEELVALAFVESLFAVHAKSHAGAAGMWQFMPATGREYMQVHHVLDERLDPILATEAAAKYLNTARKRLETWPLAITSYNYGRAGMARAVDAVGSNDFDVILAKYEHPRFGFAARNYYACFVALLDVVRRPERYFPNLERESPWQFDLVRLPFPVISKDLRRVPKLTMEQLAQYNPSWTRATLRGNQVLPEGMAIRLPVGFGVLLANKLMTWSEDDHMRTANHIRYRHRASGRESIARIARRYKVPARTLAKRVKRRTRSRPKRGTRIPIPSVPVQYSLLPSARGMSPVELPDATFAANPKRPVASEQSNAPSEHGVRFVDTRALLQPGHVRGRVQRIDRLPNRVSPPLAADAWVGSERGPMQTVDAVVGDPGHNAPWALPENDPVPAPGRVDGPPS